MGRCGCGDCAVEENCTAVWIVCTLLKLPSKLLVVEKTVAFGTQPQPSAQQE